MPKFILIDHSLKGVGGHHYEYASHILCAAEDAGFQIALATHRKFQPGDGFSDRWRILPTFRYSTYSNYTIYHSCSSSRSKSHETHDSASTSHSAANERWPARLQRKAKEHLFHSARRRRISSFARSLKEVFDRLGIEEGDQVFIPTLSELDFVGLADFLSQHPSSRRAQWHLQFHYNFFAGREPDYPGQTQQFDATREIFRTAINSAAGHRLHFYNTTQQLAVQYNRLGVARFHGLPYPINPALYQETSHQETSHQETACERDPDASLRVTCVGAIRKEKGYDQLHNLLHDLWDDYFATGRTRLVVQSNKRKFVLPLPADSRANDATIAGDNRPLPVEYAPHPLDMDQYVDLIRQADIGLLLYDSERYYVRCSGVLVEMLSVGVPVIATAGCWMAEQIAEPIFQHIDRLAESLPEISRLAIDAIVIPDEESPQHGQALESMRDVPTDATDLIVRWQWEFPTEHGTYVGLTIEQFDAEGQLLDAPLAIVGHRDGPRAATALFHLNSSATGIRIGWRNAYHDGPIHLADVSLHFMTAAELALGSCPAGAVGLIAADASQVGSLVRDLVTHWPHYRKTAQDFSPAWIEYHNPHRIVSELLEQAGLLNRPAVA